MTPQTPDTETDPSYMIEAHHLRKVFRLPRGRHVEAVRDVSLHVEPGEIYGLLGPNGAGKTTFLRMLGTIITPTSGYCTIDGIRTDVEPGKARGRIGFLSGNTKLYGRLTPTEILQYFGRLYGMSPSLIAERTDELAELLDMNTFMSRRCNALSTGQLQKVSIARVLVHDPPVLILDEPTLGLDIMTSRTILDFIASAKDRGRSIIFSTHYMTEAELLCDRIGLIHQGELLAEGSMSALYEETGATNLKDAFLHMVDERGAVNGEKAPVL